MSERIGTDTAEILPGSFGADIILGLGGNDRIDGNAGSDTLAGNAGLDTILGGSDNDFLFGGQDQDLLYGNEGNDTIFGNKGIDTLEGGSGDDVIFGGQGDDVILGGIGNDVIWGDLGADSLIGGSGADVFVLTRKSGGATLEEADVIADFVPGIDSIGLANSIETKSLNITFQSIANSSSNVNVIVQDLSTGQILAVVKNVRRSDFTSNDIFTTVLDPSSTVDPGEIPGSETDTDDQDPDLPPLEPVTRESVGKSAPLTTNTTIVTFQDSAYPFSLDDFSYFDIDGDPFSAVRITSLPGQGDLFLTSTTKDATTGASTVTRQPVTVDAEIAKASLSSLIFVPDPNTTGADYASFTFRVSDGANLSNVGTAAVIVKDKSLRPIGETNAAAPTIDVVKITGLAKEPENGTPKPVQLFSDIDLFDDSGKLTKVVVSLSGGSPAAGEDILSVTGLPAEISALAYDVANRTLTLSGAALVDAYEKVLKQIQYTNTVNSLPKDPRTVKVTIEDGLNPVVSASEKLTVAADDDLIEIKNADTSALTATESAAASDINPISLPIFTDGIGALTFEDPDNNGAASTGSISQIKVLLSGGLAEDSLVSGSLPSTATASGGGTRTLTLAFNGSATLANYVAALKAINFRNSSEAPTPSTTTPRAVSIEINGGSSSTVRSINVSATNDPPDIATSSIVETSYSVPNTSPLTFNVSDLLTDAGAIDRDSSPINLVVTATSTGGAPSGTWSYSDNGTTFTPINLAGGATQAVSSGGQLRFSGATSVGTTNPSLSFRASDGSATSSGTVGSGIATLSFPLQDSGTTINSGAINGIDANLSGKVTIEYTAATQGVDTITNFNPTQDVIRFKSPMPGVSSIFTGGINVGNANANPNSTVSGTSDIVFFVGSTNTNLETFLDNAGTTLQSSTIVVHRLGSTGTTVRLWYVQDGVPSTSIANPPAIVQHTKTQMATINMDSATASTTWDSFITNATQTFEFIV